MQEKNTPNNHAFTDKYGNTMKITYYINLNNYQLERPIELQIKVEVNCSCVNKITSISSDNEVIGLVLNGANMCLKCDKCDTRFEIYDNLFLLRVKKILSKKIRISQKRVKKRCNHVQEQEEYFFPKILSMLHERPKTIRTMIESLKIVNFIDQEIFVDFVKKLETRLILGSIGKIYHLKKRN